MNIILFTSSTNKSGGSRQAMYLGMGMAERGHKVRLFVPKGARLPELAPEWPGWETLKDWRRDIEAAMPKNEPCVVHAFHNAAVKRAAWWGLFWKKRAVVAAHRGVLFRPNNPLPYWSPGIDAFLVNSEACGRVLRKIGLSSKRLFYVPNAVPDERIIPERSALEVRASLGISEDALVFLYVGNNNPIKGHAELLRAFAKAFPGAHQPDGRGGPHLILVGLTGEARTEAGAGLSGRVHYLEPTEKVADYLCASSVFVLPSLSESMPNTLLEAMRAGLPAIGTRVGAVPDILDSSGLLAPPGDVEALAASMKELAASPGLRADLAARSLEASARYRPEVRLDSVERIYAGLLRKKGLA